MLDMMQALKVLPRSLDRGFHCLVVGLGGRRVLVEIRPTNHKLEFAHALTSTQLFHLSTRTLHPQFHPARLAYHDSF